MLSHYYGIQNWDFPDENLRPPVPGRADYIYYIADLLAESNHGEIPIGDAITCLDVGLGAICIYAEKYLGKLKVISISLDQTKDFFDGLDERIDFPGRSLWAVGGFDSDFAKYFGIVAIPKYVMLDSSGVVLMVGSLESVTSKCAELFN